MIRASSRLGTALNIDSANWLHTNGQALGATQTGWTVLDGNISAGQSFSTTDSFFNFSEVRIENIADLTVTGGNAQRSDEDNKVNVTGLRASTHNNITDANLNFGVTLTDGDGDQVTRSLSE